MAIDGLLAVVGRYLVHQPRSTDHARTDAPEEQRGASENPVTVGSPEIYRFGVKKKKAGGHKEADASHHCGTDDEGHLLPQYAYVGHKGCREIRKPRGVSNRCTPHVSDKQRQSVVPTPTK